MSRETKFGYGFLLAGVGLPYLIDKLFSQTAATVAAAVCLLVGIWLLLAGHLHERSGLALKIISALVAFVLIGGGTWRRLNTGHTQESRPSPPPTNSVTSPNKSATPETAIKPMRESRLEVYNVVGVPSSDGKRTGFFFNVFYVNKGNIAVTAMSHRSIIADSAELMDRDKELEFEQQADAVSPPPPAPTNEIQPGIAKVPPEHYFSAPVGDKEIVDLGAKYQSVLANRNRIYLFVTMKYTDRALPKNKVRISEFCGWFMGTFDMWHNCGSSRVYIGNR